MSGLEKDKKPSKPYPSFPLTAHNNGQWCKKIRGKVHFFGVWQDPHAALDNYLHQAADLHAGRLPAAQRTIPVDGVTVKDVSNHFLSYQLEKIETGEIDVRWFEDCRRVVENFAAFIGSGRLVSNLTPEDFQRFRHRLTLRGLGKKGGGLGVYALNRAITVVRGMFKYAYEMDLIDRPVKCSKAMEKVPAALMRKSRQAAEQANGKRMFQVAEVLAMLKAASIPLNAMIALAVNGGFGNTDCARLPRSVVDLDQGLIEFARSKTGVERTVPLWPETVAYMRDALASRPKPGGDEEAKLFFLTPSGHAWVRQHVHRSPDNVIDKVVSTDDVCREFEEMLKALKFGRKGVGFYALRHTFRTWADEVRDQHAIHRIMGHAIPGMSGVYVEEIGLDRLRAVTDHVRSKIFLGNDEKVT